MSKENQCYNLLDGGETIKTAVAFLAENSLRVVVISHALVRMMVPWESGQTV